MQPETQNPPLVQPQAAPVDPTQIAQPPAPATFGYDYQSPVAVVAPSNDTQPPPQLTPGALLASQLQPEFSPTAQPQHGPVKLIVIGTVIALVIAASFLGLMLI